MTKEILYEMLLNLNNYDEIFVTPNIYLDKYIDLIFSSRDVVAKKFQTQKHHIIPKSFFKLVGLSVDNSDNNTVNLLYRDHILAHYYLSLCTEGRFKYNNISALQHIIGTSEKINEYKEQLDEEFLDDLQTLYQYRKSFHSQLLKGRLVGDKNPAKQPEVRKKISEAKLGHEVTEQTKEKIRNKNKGKRLNYHPTYSQEGKKQQIESKLGDKNPAKRPEVRLKNSLAHQDIIRITNGIDNYTIKKDELSFWRSVGFYKGVTFCDPGYIKINDGKATQVILESDYENYFNQGFRKGCVNKSTYVNLKEKLN